MPAAQFIGTFCIVGQFIYDTEKMVSHVGNVFSCAPSDLFFREISRGVTVAKLRRYPGMTRSSSTRDPDRVDDDRQHNDNRYLWSAYLDSGSSVSLSWLGIELNQVRR